MDGLFQINRQLLRDAGVSLSSFLFMVILSMYPKTKAGLNLLLVIEYGFVQVNEDGSYSLTDKGESFVKEINEKSATKAKVKKIKPTESLLESIKLIFPEGKKPDTTIYWRSNKTDVSNKLTDFYSIYGFVEDDKIIEAANKYVSSFGDNRRLMRTLRYFILKDGESDLATFLENVGEVVVNDEMWNVKLC